MPTRDIHCGREETWRTWRATALGLSRCAETSRDCKHGVHARFLRGLADVSLVSSLCEMYIGLLSGKTDVHISLAARRVLFSDMTGKPGITLRYTALPTVRARIIMLASLGSLGPS